MEPSRLRIHLFQFAVAFDQLLNTVCGGWADETLSARAFRSRHCPGWRFFMEVVDAIFFWQTQHCRTAHKYEQMRLKLNPDYRKEGP